jgi:ubiquinone biosynthesis protein
MSGGRAKLVARVLTQLFIGEVSSAVGLRRRRRGDADSVDRQKTRARAIRHALESLGPFYVKVGQMLSTRPDMMPQYMIDELQNLHEKVSVAPFDVFEPVLEEELGREWREMFLDITTDKPLGAASLAQVYSVTLRTGERAVIKVQRPGVDKVMLDDMALLKKLGKFFAKRAPDLDDVFDFAAMMEVIFEAMEAELDFRVEARNMNSAREAMEGFETLAVPEVIFVTKKVMVQQLAPGTSIRDANRDKFTDAERAAIGRELLSFMYRGFFVDRMFHADPHPGNVFVEPGGKAYLIDWGMVGRMDKRRSLTVAGIMVAIAQNDGQALAKAWIELGRASSWANIPAFVNDCCGFVPSIADASMEDLNFGVALTSILKFSTRRGIQTSPLIALIGKAFANVEGSVRYLSPEISITDVFEDEFRDILFDLVRELLSQETAAGSILDLMTGSMSVVEQIRTLGRDLSNREFTVNVNSVQAQRSRHEDRADAREARNGRRVLIAVGLAAWVVGRRARL